MATIAKNKKIKKWGSNNFITFPLDRFGKHANE
jgi:hypothetical protein